MRNSHSRRSPCSTLPRALQALEEILAPAQAHDSKYLLGLGFGVREGAAQCQ